RIVVDVKDSIVYKQFANDKLPIPFAPRKFPYLHYQTSAEFFKDNTYTYHAVFAPGTPDSIVSGYILSDLGKSLPIKAVFMKRQRDSYVVRVKDNKKIPPAVTINDESDRKTPFTTTSIVIDG